MGLSGLGRARVAAQPFWVCVSDPLAVLFQWPEVEAQAVVVAGRNLPDLRKLSLLRRERDHHSVISWDEVCWTEAGRENRFSAFCSYVK